MKIFTAGGASFNSIIKLPEFPDPIPATIHQCDYKETVGNTGVGKAVSLSKLGFDVTFHAMIGNDLYGKMIHDYLDQPGLTLMYDVDPQGSERHLNLLNQHGQRISIFMNPSSDEPEIDYSKFVPLLNASDYVVINISNYCRNILPLCKSSGLEIWTDLHDYDGELTYHEDFFNAADYVFLSSDNLNDYRPFMEKMIAEGKKLVVCTHGKDGSTALTADGWTEMPIVEEYQLTESNGAGDAYFSGFLYGFSQGYDIKKCMSMGTIAGGLCIESEMIAREDLSRELIESEYERVYGL